MAKLAVTGNTTAGWTLEQDIEGYRAAGLAGIGVWWHKIKACGIERAVQLLEQSGLAVSSLNYAGCFALEDASTQPALMTDAREAVELAARLKAATLSVMPGPRANLTRKEALKLVREGLAAMVPLAEAHKVRLALEPHHPMYTDTMAVVNTLPLAVSLVRELRSPWLGILLDVYHTWWSHDVLAEYADAAGLIFNVHVDDWRHPTRDLVLDRALPGEGIMPLVELLSAIRATGYDGWYEIEVRSMDYEQRDYEALLQRCVAAWEHLWAQVEAQPAPLTS